MSHMDFELAAGSVIGRDHRHVFRNNQDALSVYRGPEGTIAVVTDGCGSSSHSEVGAQIGARLVVEAIRRQLESGAKCDWEAVLEDVLDRLAETVVLIGGNYRRTVEDFLLFTIIGVVLNSEDATFFALGDGVLIVNGETITLGPFPGNQPPYVGYGLLPGRVAIDTPIRIGIVANMPLAQLDQFAIGCDGLTELIAVEQACLPGSEELVGPISQFWADRYFNGNPDLVNRRLRQIGRDWPKKNPDLGLLSDDTTIILGRRKQPQM